MKIIFGRAQATAGGKSTMDFIEKWFGLSPDGGDGSLEVLWLVAIVVVVAVLFRGIRVRLAARQTRGR